MGGTGVSVVPVVFIEVAFFICDVLVITGNAVVVTVDETPVVVVIIDCAVVVVLFAASDARTKEMRIITRSICGHNHAPFIVCV